jgi:hypothetical protein
MMDEPDRMLNQTGSSLERALLQEGRSYGGPDELRARTLAALGLAGSAGLATGGALVWLAARTWSTKALLAISAVTVLVAVPVAYVTFGWGERSVAVPAPLPAVVPQPSREATPVAALPQEFEAPAPSPAAASSVAPAPSTARASAASASSALRAELAALDAVRSTLASGDSVGALAFLDAYFRTFPRGRLHLEAEVLRIDAFAKGGRVTDARKSAEDFLKRHPNSVLAARVQTYAGR